jgi:hypothetical protein
MTVFHFSCLQSKLGKDGHPAEIGTTIRSGISVMQLAGFKVNNIAESHSFRRQGGRQKEQSISRVKAYRNGLTGRESWPKHSHNARM